MNHTIVFDKSQFTMHFTIDNRFQCSETFSREAYKSIPGAWAMAQSLARMGANPHQIRTAVLNIVKTFYEVKIFKTAPMVPAKPARKETPVRTSASEASRHRESDDAGGDDDEDSDPARVRYLQRARVLSLLLAGKTVTQKYATTLEIHRLAARICELKERGWNIQKTTLPGRFASYFIADKDNPLPLARKEAYR
jgi:hypothetical protein